MLTAQALDRFPPLKKNLQKKKNNLHLLHVDRKNTSDASSLLIVLEGPRAHSLSLCLLPHQQNTLHSPHPLVKKKRRINTL